MAWVELFRGWRSSKFVVAMLNHVDLWLLPMVIVVAWFYFPYCQTGPNLCIWKALLHRNCPGCGLTRGICFLVHGHVREGMAFNRMSPVVLLLMILNFGKDVRSVFR